MKGFRRSNSKSEKLASTLFSWHPCNLHLHCVSEVDYFDENDQTSYKFRTENCYSIFFGSNNLPVGVKGYQM